MNALIKFNNGILKLPLRLQLWVMLLVAANVITPIFFLHRLEALVVLATTLASMVLMVLLTARFGFTRIVGLGHILWIPMLAFLFTRLANIPASDSFGIWLRALFMLNGISLVLDAVDLTRYIRGERQEIVSGTSLSNISP